VIGARVRAAASRCAARYGLFASVALVACGGDSSPREAASGTNVSTGPAPNAAASDTIAPSLRGGPGASPGESASAKETSAPSPLDGFRADLLALTRGERRDHVRILVFGDSHTAADLWTGSIRKALQTRFGDGGPGFFHVGMAGARHDSMKPSQDGRTETLPKQPSTVERTGDGILGLGGVLVQPKSKPVTVLIAPRAAIAASLRWELCVRPGSKTSRVVLTPRGGAPVIRSFVKGDDKKVTVDRLSTVTHDPHEIEVRIEGDAALCGAIAETEASKKPGVVLDALGINGARVATVLARDEAAFIEDVRRRSPSLVMIEFGGNEAAEDGGDIDAFAEDLTKLVLRVRKAAPTAGCLVVGPTEQIARPARTLAVSRAFAERAATLGCAFWDAQEKLGGPGAMKKMMDEYPPRAHADGIHLLERGYRDMAKLTVDDLLRGVPPD